MTDTELKSSLAQAVQRGIVFRNPKRVMVRQQDYRSTNSNPGGPLRHRRANNRSGRKETAERMKVVFRQPYRIKAELFRIPRLLNDRAQSLAAFSASARKR